jgi:hypothetical protein
MDGGGGRGKDIGIAHGMTTTQGGNTIKAFHLFIEGYPQTGEMTTGIIVGEVIGGTTNEYITKKLNETGEAGKRVNIGRSNKRGVSKGSNLERGHNTWRQVHNPEKANNRTHSNNKATLKEEK